MAKILEDFNFPYDPSGMLEKGFSPNTPEKYEYHRARRFRLEYGITLEEYDSMVESQKHRCKICGSLSEQLVVDHCHRTNRVRGLLCHGCNSGLGFFEDSPERMICAIEYLNEGT